MTHAEFIRERYDGKRVALIGGSGQVGQFLLPILKQAGAEVEIYDCAVSAAGGIHQHHIYDLIDNAGQARRNIEWWKPHYVFNLSAKVSGVTYNERAHFDMALQNVLLQAIPFWLCERIETRFVQFSTVCVLPHDAPVPTAEVPVDQLGLPEPSNLGYGLAKQFGEWLCRFACVEKGNFSVLCLRPSNLYGRERPDDPNGHVIPRFTWRLLNREDPMKIRGLPTTERSFLHAEDCAEASAILAATPYCGTVNVPACDPIRMSDLLSCIAREVGWMPRHVEWGDASQQGYEKRQADRSIFDNIIRDTGLPYWASRELREGIAEYVDWARMNFEELRCLETKTHDIVRCNVPLPRHRYLEINS